MPEPTPKPSVIVGYDQSPSGDRALAEAGREAAWRGTGVTVVNAFHWTPVTNPVAYFPVDIEASLKEYADQVAGAGADWLRRRHPGMAVASAAVPGPTGQMLADAARNAELLVLGNRGLGGFAGLMLGSVSMRALTLASCPTMVVRGAPREGAGVVVLALDIEEAAEEVVKFAFAEASGRAAGLLAIHAWDPEWTGMADLEADDELRTARARATMVRRAALESLVGPWQWEYPDVRLTVEIAEGSPSAVLTAATETAGLIVAGAHRRDDGWLGMRFGPIVHTLLHHAGCPVAVVPRK